MTSPVCAAKPFKRSNSSATNAIASLNLAIFSGVFSASMTRPMTSPACAAKPCKVPNASPIDPMTLLSLAAFSGVFSASVIRERPSADLTTISFIASPMPDWTTASLKLLKLSPKLLIAPSNVLARLAIASPNLFSPMAKRYSCISFEFLPTVVVTP